MANVTVDARATIEEWPDTADRTLAEAELRLEASGWAEPGRPAQWTFRFRTSGIDLTGRSLDWLTVTTSGWAHLRGTVTRGAGIEPLLCRIDVYRGGSRRGRSRISVRVYPPGADPERDGPTYRASGFLRAEEADITP